MADDARETSTTSSGLVQQAWVPRFNPWLIAVSVMLATIMEVLDTTVANVALPQMAGNLSVTTDEATWMLTSYLVANAIVLPMTGWIGSVFGRKRFLMTCIACFTVASASCGLAPSMGFLVFSRILQGAAGGALQPLAQAILMESFPPQKRGVASAVYGLGVIVAPIVGPTLGGWITDNYSWRWVFLINMPMGALAFFMCKSFVEDPPYIRARARHGGKIRVDFIGFAFLALWLATLQIFLDKGQDEDWTASAWICWLMVISGVSMVAFIFWELRVKHPLVELRILKNRNFAMGTAMITLLGVVLYATLTMLPLFLQGLMGYTALDSGLAMSPRGIGALASVMIVGQLITRIDSRFMVGLGFCILAFATHMFTGINLQITNGDIIIPNVVMGLAMGLIFVPLTMLTMGDLPNEKMSNATGIFNLMRNIGGSIGISLITTFLARRAQVHQALLCGHMSQFNPVFMDDYHKATAAYAASKGVAAGGQMALASLYRTLLSQSSLCAYMDCFRFMVLVSLICVTGAFFFRRLKHSGPAAAAH